MVQRSPISPASAQARNQRLSVIAEDGTNTPVPPIPPRGGPHNPRVSDSSSFTLPIQGSVPNSSPGGSQPSHRPQSRRWTDKPPGHGADSSPPAYQHWPDDAPRSRRQIWLEKVRGSEQFAKRGGWKRLLIGIILLIAIAIALGVGLGVGLTRRNAANNNNSSGSGSSSGSSGSGSGSSTPQVFPEGSYAIPVYSLIVNTACTAISSTWLCYPYSTYTGSNPTAAVATYNWIISGGDNNNPPSTFNISTSSNPFANMFSNVPLTLTNNGTADEAYVFEVPMVKSVVPTTAISANGQTTTCFYNSTILRGELYTRKASANISSAAAAASAQQSTNSGSNMGFSNNAAATNWTSWPGAVNITQYASGGQDVPNCYLMNSDGSLGARVTNGLTQQSASTTCVCGYRNFGF